jgi:putative transposase
VADFTYVWTLHGFCYTALCVEVFSRRVLGWRVMTSKTTALVTSVLEQALFTRRYAEFRFTATGLVHHSDAGSQTRFNRWTQHLDDGGVFDGTTTGMGGGVDGAGGYALTGTAAGAQGS